MRHSGRIVGLDGYPISEEEPAPLIKPRGQQMLPSWRGNNESSTARGYGYRWQQARLRHLHTFPLCAICDRTGRITVATVVDHRIPHRGDQTLFWDEQNWQSLCKACHDRKTWLESRDDGSFEALRFPADLRPSRIPVTILCGPPGSGKSTHLRQNARASDVVIDLDRIVQEFSGLPEHHTSARWLEPALRERNRRLRLLATDTEHAKAWLVIAAPSPRERAIWAQRLGADIHLMSTPLAECVKRINADPAREGQRPRMIAVAHDWFRQQPRRDAIA